MPRRPDPEQSLAALRRATEVRLTRAALKRDVARQPSVSASRALAAEVVLDPPGDAHRMPIVDLLMACRKVGPTNVGELLAAAGCSELRPLGALTPSQRERLAWALRC